MEIVIDIPRGFYEHVKGHKDIFTYGLVNGEKVGEIIANGTVLPEQHGDLIDRDKLLKDDIGKVMGFRESDIRNAHTILKGR